MQNKVVVKMPLLDEVGNLSEPGWSTDLVWDYHRDDIKANKLRIKEWDYYLIYNQDIALALTIADNSYMGLISASLINFKARKEKTNSVMTLLPKGKYNLPETSKTGNTVFKNEKVEMRFLNDGKTRKLFFNYPNFEGTSTLSGEIELTKQPEDSMVIATPFNKNKHFYYNQKIVGFRADGYLVLGNKKVEFLSRNTFALLDWGRGVWTYKNTWYWGAGAGQINGVDFGFNIGYGFGNTQKATENILFYNGVAHKLSQVKFNIPKTADGKDDYLSPWSFTSDDGRFEMDFAPILNRSAYTSAVVVKSRQNQVFGRFTGKAILDDGTVLQVKDFLGFAEKVFNKW